MDLFEFENYLDKSAHNHRTKPLARMVTNAFGMQEKVVMPRSYWQYAMWLEDQYDYDLKDYFIQCDQERTDWTLSETVMYWLHHDMKERLANGETLPDAYEMDETYV